MKYAVSLINCLCMVYVCTLTSSEELPPKLERDPSLIRHNSHPEICNTPKITTPEITTADGEDDFCVVTSKTRTPSATSINSSNCPPNSPNNVHGGLTVIVTPAISPLATESPEQDSQRLSTLQTSPARLNRGSSHNTPAITPAQTPSPFPSEVQVQDQEQKQPEQSVGTLALQVQAAQVVVLTDSGANSLTKNSSLPSPKQSCLKCLRCCLPCCWWKKTKRG